MKDLWTYMWKLNYQKQRYVSALRNYMDEFGSDDVEIYSAPGRSEVGGNHTDHQNGEILAASINLDAIGIVKKTTDNKVTILSKGYTLITISLDNLEMQEEEKETTIALIKGVLETDRTLPTNCYGETKLSMEKMFKWTSKAHNLRFVSLRYFNACGAHPNGKIGEAHNPETHLIPLILQVPNNQREYIAIFGKDYDTKDGTCVRDYIHVNDLAQAHILAMKYLRNGGESDIFNLGNGVGFTVKEVIETARKVTGHAIPAKEEARRAGDPSTLIASSEKAKSILGWNPKYADLETIIDTAWRWHKGHPNGYQTV